MGVREGGLKPEDPSTSCRDAIVDLYERHAPDYDRDRSRSLQEREWLDRLEYEQLLAASGFEVRAYLAEDAACGNHTVWLSTYLSRPAV